MMKRVLCIIVCLYGITSCATSSRELDKSTINIHLTDERKPLLADSIFSAVKYIPLETTENSLIGEIDKLYITDSLYYLLDGEQESIFVFNKEGRFRKKLQKRGRGHGEYITLDDFFVKDSLLYVLSSHMKKILIYDSEFKFVSDFKLESHGTNISYLDETLFHFTNFSSEELKQFYIYDLKEKNCIGSHHSFPEKQRGVSSTQTTFASYKDSMFFSLPYEYSIYHLSKDGVTKKYELNFGEKYMWSSSFRDYTPDERHAYRMQLSHSEWEKLPVNDIDNLHIDSELMFFTFVKGTAPYSFFKWNNVVKYGCITGTKRFTTASGSVLAVNSEQYIHSVSPERFLFLREKGYVFSDNLKNLKLDDNPVLCIYTMKHP